MEWIFSHMDELDQPEATPAATNQQPAAAPAASGSEQFTDGSGSMNHCLHFVIRSEINRFNSALENIKFLVEGKC